MYPAQSLRLALYHQRKRLMALKLLDNAAYGLKLVSVYQSEGL